MSLTKNFCLILILSLLCILMSSCGPSPEELSATSAAQTAAATTSTPANTQTPLPTSTPPPAPYDLSVSVMDTDGLPLIGASVIVVEIKNESRKKITDDNGQVFWNDLPGESLNISIRSPGYRSQDAPISIDRGLNQIEIKLERDPFGLHPDEACLPGENLIYIEDFQDNRAQRWNVVEFGKEGWELIPHPDMLEDIIAGHKGNQDSRAHLEDSNLANAVWRFSMMISGRGEYFLFWDWAEPTTVEGADFSSYQLDSSAGASIQDNFSLYRVAWPTKHTTIYQQYHTVEENVWHKFEVSYYEGRSEVWVNDNLWFFYQDPDPLPSGEVGFEVRPYDDKEFALYFDDISICELSGPFTHQTTLDQ